MARLLKLLILLPIAVLALAFAIANRAMTVISLDPFSPAETASTRIAAPLFVILLLTLIVGVLLGSFATWLAQGRNRHSARAARHEAARLRADMEHLRTQTTARALDRRAIAPSA